jgi:hypothetical protein
MKNGFEIDLFVGEDPGTAEDPGLAEVAEIGDRGYDVDRGDPVFKSDENEDDLKWESTGLCNNLIKFNYSSCVISLLT